MVRWTNITNSYHPNAAGQSGGYYPIFRGKTGVSLTAATQRTARTATTH